MLYRAEEDKRFMQIFFNGLGIGNMSFRRHDMGVYELEERFIHELDIVYIFWI